MNADHPSELTTAAPESVEPTSVWSKMFSIFAAPGEVFEEIRNTKPATANWLVPTLLSCLVGIVFSVVVLSQPDILAASSQQQEAQFQKSVDAGKMTLQQMEQRMEGMQKIFTPALMMSIGITFSLVGPFVFLFILAALSWLLAAKVFKGRVNFMKAFELVGLAGMINVLGGLLTMFVVLLKGDLNAAPNAALLLDSFDPANVSHQLLGALNIFTIWFMLVLAIGVSRVTGRSLGGAAGWIFGFWLVVRGVMAVGSVALAKLQS